MKAISGKRILQLFAALAVFAFAADFAADSFADLLSGHCDVQTSHSSSSGDELPCSHCVCAAHAGAVVLGDFVVLIPSGAGSSDSLPGDVGRRPVRMAQAIDHPPQLP